jgi:hypothetical protein
MRFVIGLGVLAVTCFAIGAVNSLRADNPCGRQRAFNDNCEDAFPFDIPHVLTAACTTTEDFTRCKHSTRYVTKFSQFVCHSLAGAQTSCGPFLLYPPLPITAQTLCAEKYTCVYDSATLLCNQSTTYTEIYKDRMTDWWCEKPLQD